MMIFWRSVLSRWSMSAASMPASVTLHSLLLAMHASSGHTPHLRDWKSFSRCHHYFLLFSDKKDNHGFRKYVFVHLSINLATPLALEIFFVNHNGFLCHIFRQWRKIPGTSIRYKDYRLIFFKYSLLCWRTSSCIFAQLSILRYSRPHV